ncbi:hypothetical protein ABMC89_00680 [Sulfitobacter sp. HNIBRBA3233]|uniref:hypothetical protein n=1 Tax=Sulfitobacter marinivivus TaxID=3158558 RepID=UPI0032E04334
MSIYRNWGFKDNLFETKALPANRQGAALMVGRDKATQKIIKGLSSSSKYVTVEGLNGVGKTSVINVAVYKSAEKQIKENDGPLFIPCRKIFQLEAHSSADEFKTRVLLEVAQTLIQARDILPIPKGYTRAPNNRRLNRWLNSIRDDAGGFSTPIGGLSYQGIPNNTEGFAKSGLEKAIVDWVQLIFPSEAEGGVVCIIDNLELLQTSKAVREALESMRDDVLAIPGLKWVLCGAMGIVEGVASSPRMAGYLQSSIKIDDLDRKAAAEIFNKRVSFYKEKKETRIPITADNFEELFAMLRGNLRAVLSEADNFCMHASDVEDDGQEWSPELFNDWLKSKMEDVYEASKDFLGKRAIEVFHVACSKESFSPSDFEDFGFTSKEALRSHVKELETAGLLVSTQDDGDKRRRTVEVLPKGWLVKGWIDRIPAE